MKILIIGSKNSGSLELSYKRALEALGEISVDHYDPDQELSFPQGRIVRRLAKQLIFYIASNQIINFIKNNRFYYDLIIIFKGYNILPGAVQKVKELCSKSVLVCINGDDPFNIQSRGATNRNIIESIKNYDYYAIWSRELVSKLQKFGAQNVIHLPFGYDTWNHFRPETIDDGLSNTITFVGCWDKEREQLLTKLADFPLRIFGAFWDRIKRNSPLKNKVTPHNIYGAELRKVIFSSKASLNIMRPQNHGAHNMRTFEIPAMGGLLITNYSDEQNAIFPNGVASLMYRDSDDLIRIVDSVLHDKYRRSEIISEAMTRCYSNSYLDRARHLIMSTVG
jgi:spore maturation protein CgeB